MIGNGSMVGMCNSIYVAHNFFVRDKKGILFFISADTDIGKIQIHGAKLFFKIYYISKNEKENS